MKLEINNKYLSHIVDNLEDVCYLSDIKTYELIYMNKKLQETLGYNEFTCKGHKCYKILQNKEKPCEFCTNEKLKENEYYKWEHYNEYLDKYFELSDTVFYDGDRAIRLEVATDITEKKEKYHELKIQISKEQMLVKCASTLCNEGDTNLAINEILDNIGKYYKANRAYLFEIDESEQYTNNTHEWCAEGVEPQIDSLQKVPISIIADWMEKFVTIGAYSIDSLTNDLDVNSSDYKILEMQDIKSLLTVPLINDERVVGFIGVDDPTINRDDLQILKTVAMFILNNLNKIEMTKKIGYLQKRDKLTQVYNRNHYDATVVRLKEAQVETVGIVYLDINGLKAINTKYGHEMGDNYITNCVDLLKEYFVDNIFRISGDEFIVFWENISFNDFDEKIKQLQKRLEKNNQVSIAMGTSWCDNLGELDKHMISSDAAMLKDKENYRRKRDEHIQFFQQSSEEILLNEIANNSFEIFLQPKVLLSNQKVVGAEALIRKKDEMGNCIAPYIFIPKYESQGNIFLIDLFVLRQACEFLATMMKNNYTQLPSISINYSRITILVTDIHIKSQEICKEYGVDPSMITIEVTEDCGFVESAAIGRSIVKLKEIGFRISLDDFGCKYSNIEILSAVSFDEVKLDKSLLNDNNNNTSKQIILEHLIEMFQSFPDIALVMEGIENKEQLELLKHNKGLIGQGYLFSKPLPKEKFLEYYIEALNRV
ncbi:MAG: EAL domain-containing protein [Lachnospiraceae bacterium]